VSFRGDTVTASIQCRNVTMEQFAGAIRPIAAGRGGNLTVVDKTGVEGNWDIDLEYAMGQGGAAGGFTEALDKLGLKLEQGTAPQPALVVSSVKEQPLPNPPGITEGLPPLPPPQFEAAAIKWPCEGDRTMALRFETGGRVTSMCEPLGGLIRAAWSLRPFQTPAGEPKWLADQGTTKYNVSIIAKAPAGLAIDPKNNQQARDLLRAMLRALLIERYQMKVHFEDRPMDSYTLVAVKPKLTKADPEGRIGCTRLNLQEGTERGMMRLTCRNMTMAQFAEQVQAYDSDIYYPVLDGTALAGSWDFTITYDPTANLSARFPAFGRGAASGGAEATEPSGRLSLEDAIEKQLGLKLETHKRPQPVLVIDHIEEKPIEN
jgi:uncharacterized protein (TIGR03435 family)